MGTQMTNKERYIKLWERLEQGIEKSYGGSFRKFAQDYVERAPDGYQYEFEVFYGNIKRRKQRKVKDSFKSVTPSTIEKIEKYCAFLDKEKLFLHSMLDDEYILTD